MNQQYYSLPTFGLLVLILLCPKTLSQSPAKAPTHAPPSKATPPPLPPIVTAPPPVMSSGAMVPPTKDHGPNKIIKILQKAGHFSYFIRLIKTTQEDIQFYSQLNSSTDGITIFAPNDSGFARIIKSGTLNALSDQEKIRLVQFHVLPRFLTTSLFQTLSNPVKTLAGSGSRLSLNVSTSDSFMNISTGLTNTSVSAIVYIDNQIAIYEVDKVLLPLDIFSPTALAPAPSPPSGPGKDDGAESPVVPKDTNSGWALAMNLHLVVAVGVGAVFFL